MPEAEHLVADEHRAHSRYKLPAVVVPTQRSESTSRRVGARKRPLVFVSGKDPLNDVGGHKTYVRAHALAAARIGFEPHIFCVGARSRVQETDFGTLHTVAGPLGFRRPVALHGPVLSRAVVGFLAHQPGPHLIHGFAIWSQASAAASRELASRGVTAIPVASAYDTRTSDAAAKRAALASQHTLAHRLHYRILHRWAQLVEARIEGTGYRASRVVLVNYQSVRKMLVDAYGDGLEIRTLPYASSSAFREREEGLDPPLPEPLAGLRPLSAPLVVAVSRHDPRKGIDVLLRALALVAATGADFRACLVGPGHLLGANRRLAADLGLTGRVTLPGRVPDVWPYLRNADVFVLPSSAEASGSVSVLEALQSPTAVIASACDGIPEDLVDGVDALLVPPGDPQALASALLSLLIDPQRRAQLAAGARYAFEQKFSAPRFVEALANVYAELGVAPV
jgi:glycosyltransferase involved in cell wall biosynthesis